MKDTEKVRNYIKDNMAIFDEDATLKNDDNIFKMGFVNSFFALRLLTFIEAEFNIKIDDQDLDIENFSSVNNILTLIEKKRNGTLTTN